MYCCEQVKNQYGHIIAQKKSSYNYLSIKKQKKENLTWIIHGSMKVHDICRSCTYSH